jgi:hypothetical protein
MKKLFLLTALMVSGHAMANCCHEKATDTYHDYGKKMCPSGWWTSVQSNCDSYAQKANDMKAKMEVAMGS